MLNNFKIGTKIGASFALALIMLSTIGIVSYRNTVQLIDTARRENHSYRVITELEDLSSRIKDAETGQRGYILTGDTRYLEPYNAAMAVIDQNLNALRQLTSDNPSQQSRIAVLEPLVNRRIALIQQTLTLQKTQGFEAARQVILTGEGKDLMDRIRAILADMEVEERELLQQRSQLATAATQQTIYTILFGVPLAFGTLILIAYFLSKNISQPLAEVSTVATKLAAGDLFVSVPEQNRQDEVGVLTRTFNQMIASLRTTTIKNNEQAWLKSNLAKFALMLQGQRNTKKVAESVLAELVPLVNAQQGVFYVMDTHDEKPVLRLLSSYAHQEQIPQKFQLGEGLIGQCALTQQKIITEVPSHYLRIRSGLGEATPQTIIVLPIVFNSQVSAVIELASLQRFSELQVTFLEQASDNLAIVLNTIASDARTQQLLQQAQALTTELQAQQEELRNSNYRLEQQQEELQQTNEELQQLNAELEEKAELLAARNQEVEQKNQEVDRARQSLEEKAAELERISQYKSQFLANMSHELRTPLNSLLILAKLLADNTAGNLTEKQVEYSRTIYASGKDLLGLINDILDLAKIESGTMSVDVNPLTLTDLRVNIERTFQQVAQDKGLEFSVEVDRDRLPDVIYTDGKRLQQVLKNLLANAFKFTEQGKVSFKIDIATEGWNPEQESLNRADAVLAFAVEDTGIGIAPDKHELIFAAFQQADGTTNRKYGGTGLGLSISREIARLLGGDIQLVSRLGEGSTFTLYLPLNDPEIRSQRSEVREKQKNEQERKIPRAFLQDDRNEIQQGDRALLIVEDDLNFARVLLDMAQQHGFKVLLAQNANDGLLLAQQYQPNGIMVDINLPALDSSALLERLQQHPKTQRIPVHTIAGREHFTYSLSPGAIAYLQKPVNSEALAKVLADIKEIAAHQVKNLLIIEDNAAQRQNIAELMENKDVEVMAVGTGAEALVALQQQRFDCLILDLGLPDMSGFELIQAIKQQDNSEIPIIVYTGIELTRQEETELKRIAQAIVIKDQPQGSDLQLGVSLERLLDETALFLHRVQATLPAPKPHEPPTQRDSLLTGKRVLIVDDDVRNIFALTSVLERYQMQVLFAENGKEAIALLEQTPNIDIVLMDVMMPEMNGYEAMQAIRAKQQFQSLPIIALTAKAMIGDREKCIAAGASDYITKPVDIEQLLSLMRVWLYQRTN
ncbi:response regulator [Chroococcidiopsis sp. TS-821]|uniref:response regulator n=1 Tax=Chroococcidiopsis sp. TS-821 TaxID=1378066 RepID=UPI000CEF2600|nr:response regulator [Chroococcidiopsis sp. TS-821]PPS44184.1 two-component system sensor histidine kinase/response regulator [Chroococcidiopsis sp. TS-821]